MVSEGSRGAIDGVSGASQRAPKDLKGVSGLLQDGFSGPQGCFKRSGDFSGFQEISGTIQRASRLLQGSLGDPESLRGT